MKLLILVTSLVFILGFLGSSTAYAIELEYTPPCLPGLPGGCPGDAEVSTNISSYIIRIYQFGVGISGILAVGMIVAGAIYYTISAGTPDKQNDAKSMITSALWGVALLLGSYLILNTINPQITTLRQPGALPPCTGAAGEQPGQSCLPTPQVTATSTSPRATVCSESFDISSPQYCEPKIVLTSSGMDAVYGGVRHFIEGGSTVWQYPYYKISDEDFPSTCFVFAWQTPEAEEPETEFPNNFIDLDVWSPC